MAEKRKLADLEFEVLISEVERRPPLWNDRHNDFKNSAVTKKLWDEIGKEMNLSGYECKKKWKNLKDTFRKRMQTLQRTSGSAASPPLKKWKFATLMEFTRDIILSSPVVGNLSSPSLGEESSTIDAEFGENSDPEPSQQQSPRTSSHEDGRFSRPHHSVRSIRKKDDIETRMMELEERKINAILNMKKQSDDQHFFLSLLPYVTRLDDLEKLQLRSKIHNCVLEAVRDHERRKTLQQYSPNTVSEVSSNACSFLEVELSNPHNNSSENQESEAS